MCFKRLSRSTCTQIPEPDGPVLRLGCNKLAVQRESQTLTVQPDPDASSLLPAENAITAHRVQMSFKRLLYSTGGGVPEPDSAVGRFQTQ